MPSTDLTFSSRAEHRAWLASQAALPRGFRVGTARFDFTPVEAPKPAKMALTLIALDQPLAAGAGFAAMFTKNAFPGAPVIVGRRRLAESPALGAIIVNNKISNVCAPGGVETAERICAEAGRLLGLPASAVLPSSTGVIGWTLPVEAMLQNLPKAVAALAGADAAGGNASAGGAGSVLPAAEGIVTTDLYPKVRSATVGTGAGAGRIVGIAKGAGMIEPNMATMLVYILTDIAVPRDELRAMLQRAVNVSFNRMSVDSDTSTSDTVVLVSSGVVTLDQAAATASPPPPPAVALAGFEAALTQVCRDLAEDVVRNGEGVRHVIRVRIQNAATESLACALGKAIVNAPLFKCAVAGNDPNVGRLVQAIGKHVGAHAPGTDLSALRASIGGIEIFANGAFLLDPQKELALVAHLKAAELYESRPAADGTFAPPVDYPPHERCVEIDVDLGNGTASATVFGADLTHEYVSENADYRS
ncbi:bifunctional ornithine acetyltransferase/N-acetylglutamate synthase [Geminisphaera colitermitum]|uniref:bifunctional ornithine acetyltransferase/N-acetylglutamate synthase n=1 Tax=Geminisphaera colitermitum TaxID=1148786 RepID=UPI0001964D47|nr:bifunctional ornithine acetyltransferase/N-acetylglutamate synthase [Geminisphaera colitermitum]